MHIHNRDANACVRTRCLREIPSLLSPSVEAAKPTAVKPSGFKRRFARFDQGDQGIITRAVCVSSTAIDAAIFSARLAKPLVALG